MKLQEWTAFIDMMGYSEITKEIKAENQAREFFEFMKTNIDIFDELNGKRAKAYYQTLRGFNLYKYYDFEYCFISDSIVIHLNPKEVNEDLSESQINMHSANVLYTILFRIEALLIHTMEKEKIFLRGGISGKFCRIKNNMAVGEGLIEAYNLESKIAKHPRIIIDPNIYNKKELKEGIEFIKNRMYGGIDLIKKDEEEEIYYFDYLSHIASFGNPNLEMIKAIMLKDENYLENQSKSIKKTFDLHANSIKYNTEKIKKQKENKEITEEKYKKIIEKYEWLIKYHNDSCKKFEMTKNLSMEP